MKVVIRKGVFETNSSSTHSLSYSVNTPKKFTFQCKSAWSRLLMLKALSNVAFAPCDYYDQEAQAMVKENNMYLEEFVNVCVDVFCKTENIKRSALTGYLANKLKESAPSDQRIPLYFNQAFNKNGDDLCCLLFSEGCLSECNCGCEDAFLLMDTIFGKTSYAAREEYERVANDYLYGMKSFVAKEKYAGSFMVDANIVL